jgi:N-acetylmuramoyl-L-alanine amidase
MNQIKKEKLNILLTDNYDYPFEITEDGIYLVEIIASAKSWWQNLKNFKSFFQDDDLAVKLDSTEFPKLNGKKSLFDGEADWNGNDLKGLSKTDVFIINLKKGNHILHFLVDKNPILESVTIYKIDDKTEINYLPEENNPAQDGNGRQWLTIIPVNVPFKNLEIKAVAKKYPQGRDDDDVKIIIDGNIQKNETGKSHKNWYWCGRILDEKEKAFSREFNLENSPHYIELWADKSPALSSMKITLASQEQPPMSGERIPTADDPEWTGDFKDDTEQMILARAIFGESRSLSEKGKIAVGWSIRNRIDDPRWGDTYQKVILEPKQYSAFNEGDKNLPYVENPFINETQINSWYECYEIAGKVMGDETIDPTDGANHYFSDYIDPPYWTKSANAEFKIKIGNTLFYDLKKNISGGFINIKKAITIFVATVVICLGCFYVAVKINNKLDCTPKLSGVHVAEHYKHFFINPKTDEIEVAYFDENGNFLEMKQITHDGYPKYNLDDFYGTETLGYFQDLHKRNEPLSENEQEYYKNYVSLFIKDNEYAEPREIYRGDVKTSSWEWLSNKNVRVYVSAGSGVRVYRDIEINSAEPFIASDHMTPEYWTPEKTL